MARIFMAAAMALASVSVGAPALAQDCSRLAPDRPRALQVNRRTTEAELRAAGDAVSVFQAEMNVYGDCLLAIIDDRDAHPETEWRRALNAFNDINAAQTEVWDAHQVAVQRWKALNADDDES